MVHAPKSKIEQPEPRPDGWARFERAVDAAVKGGPKHRAAKEQVKAAPSKKPSKVNTRT
jgi:hypothetical protein